MQSLGFHFVRRRKGEYEATNRQVGSSLVNYLRRDVQHVLPVSVKWEKGNL